MADVVEMIQLSPTMEEGLIVEWMKKEGDEVETGDIIAEVETDKATMEMESFFDGVILKILAPEGEAAKVGTAIAIIGEEGEDIADLLAELEGSGGAGGKGGDAGTDDDADDADDAEDTEAESDADDDADDADDADDSDDAESDAGADDDPAADEDKGGSAGADKAASPDAKRARRNGAGRGEDDTGGRIRSSPLARKIAEEKGIALADIKGSGPGGRIVRKDVEAAAKQPRKAAPPKTTQVADGDGVPGGEDIALSQMRKTIAKRLSEAWQAPAFMLTRTIAMDSLLALRAQINEDLEASGAEAKVSVNDLLIRACALGLREVPEMNAAWLGDRVRLFDTADIGVAVAIEGGLITPVVRRAHEKSVGTIAAEARELIGRARKKKLAPEEYSNATFSISNLGMMGIEHFTAVLNPPAAGILAVGAVRRVPVVTEEGELGIGQRMTVTLTCDHRTVDGAVGARFLEAMARRLERPMTLLL